MLWTSFEASVEDLLILMFRTKPTIFIGWAGDSKISFAELQKMFDLNSAKNALYQKAVKAFTAQAIESRIKTLTDKLNGLQPRERRRPGVVTLVRS